MVEAFTPIAAKIDEAWETVTGEIVTYDEPNGGEAIDRQSIAEWLDGAGAGGWFRKLLDVGYTTEYGREIDEQSAWNLLMMIDTNPDPFRIFGDSDERFHIRGGNDQVPTKLAAALGDRVETGVRLEALSRAADGELPAGARDRWRRARGRRRPRRSRPAVHHAARGAGRHAAAGGQAPGDRRARATAPTPS